MEMYEVSAALRYSHYCVKQEWEMTRILGYITAQVQSTKKLKQEEIIKLPWDDEKEEIYSEESTKITKADIERLNKIAQAYLKEK